MRTVELYKHGELIHSFELPNEQCFEYIYYDDDAYEYIYLKHGGWGYNYCGTCLVVY